MNYLNKESHKGFTLIEMTLVLVVISSILVMLIGYVSQKSSELRRDRVSLQLQQILNAALAYYVDKGKWPVASCGASGGGGGGGGAASCGSWYDLSTLQKAGYLLPSSANLVSPFGQNFCVSCNDKVTTGGGGGGATTTQINGTFSVRTNVLNPNEAVIIAGRMPFGFVSDQTGSNTSPPTTTCSTSGTLSADCTTVITSVSVPGQNLNNARSVNFANIYKSGACVPAPVCPGNMKPQIFVTPTSISGVYNKTTTSVVYPLTSFTAYARGSDSSDNPGDYDKVYDCSWLMSSQKDVVPCGFSTDISPNVHHPKPGDPDGDPVGTKYWRVCLNVVTEPGTVNPTDIDQGQRLGSILAITRCVPTDANGKPNDVPKGSPFNYFEPNKFGLP